MASTRIILRAQSGLRGPQGEPGADGANGANGTNGAAGPTGSQGPPGPGTGAGAWQATTAYTTSQVVQAPDGTFIVRIASGTSRSSYDATEKAAWTNLLVPKVSASIDLCSPPYSLSPGDDITTAMQAAVNTLAALPAGGDIYFSKIDSNHPYTLNGAPQTGTALGYSYNGQILFPATAWNGGVGTPIRIHGATRASSGAPSTGAANGLVIQSNASGAYMFDCVPGTSMWGWQWTGIMPIFEDIILRSPTGGTAGGVNAICAIRAKFERVTVDTPVSPGLQPTGTLMGLVSPHGANNGDVTFRDVSVRGLHTGIGIEEHNVLDNLEFIGCENAFQCGVASHSIWLGYVDVEQCHSVFYVPSGGFAAVYGHLDVEMSGVASGAWNAPLHLEAPSSNGAITGALNINIVGSPAGGLALGNIGYNLDTALTYTPTGQRGGLGGWRTKHPSDTFARLQNHAFPAGNGGTCWPSMHPWRNVTNSVTIDTTGKVKGTSSSLDNQIVVPTLRGGVSRRISFTANVAASGYNVQVIGHRVSGGTNAGNHIQFRAAGGVVGLLFGGSVITSAAFSGAGATHTFALDLVCGPDHIPTVARGYVDGVLQVSHTLTAAEQAALVPDSTTYPYVEDGLGFGGDTTSYGISAGTGQPGFEVTDLPDSDTRVMGCRLTLTAALSLANSTFTNIPWDTEAWDSNGFHDNVTNPDRVGVPVGCGGVYLAQVGWGTSSSMASGRMLLRLTLNGTAIPGGVAEIGGVTGLQPAPNVSTVVRLAPNDIIRAQLFQTSGSPLATDLTLTGMTLTKIAD